MGDLERRLAALKGVPVAAPAAAPSSVLLLSAAVSDEEQLERMLQIKADEVRLQRGPMVDLERRLAAMKGVSEVAPAAAPSRVMLPPAAALSDDEQLEMLLQIQADEVRLERGQETAAQPIQPLVAGGSAGMRQTPGRDGTLQEEVQAALAEAGAALKAERQPIAGGSQDWGMSRRTGGFKAADGSSFMRADSDDLDDEEVVVHV